MREYTVKVVQLRFVLSADFRLVEFAYVAPLKVVDVVNASTAVMSFDEIIERIKTQLSLDDMLNARHIVQYILNIKNRTLKQAPL